MVVAVGAMARRELPVPGRDLAGIHQAMDYLPLANRACEGDFDGRPPLHAEGRHVVIVGGGDTGADCLGTALRQGAASVVQLDINPLPGEDRAPHQPWPVYPKIYRTSSAHQEARELAGLRGEDWDSLGVPAPGPDGDVRVFSASTFRLAGDENGHVRALHLVGVEPEQRRPQPGTEREIPADLVLLVAGLHRPRTRQWHQPASSRCGWTRGATSPAGPTSAPARMAYSWPVTRDGGPHCSCGRSQRAVAQRPPSTAT